MKEIGILFSALMVQADLDGLKSETRRTRGLKEVNECPDDWEMLDHHFMDERGNQFEFKNKITGKSVWFKRSPYGGKGDIHWVRETYRKVLVEGIQEAFIQYASDNPDPIYELDGDGFHVYNKDGTEKMLPWKPSIHMPKVACRIWHEVIDVYPERLYDITDASAIAEGIKRHVPVPGDGETIYKNYMGENNAYTYNPKKSFMSLWEKINGRENLLSNPWVWVIRYKVLSTTGRPEKL